MSIGDIVNQPVSKDDIVQATRVIVRTGNVSPIVLSRYKISYSKSLRIIAMLEGANIVSGEREGVGRVVLIKDETQAVNAALRRFNKGKRGK